MLVMKFGGTSVGSPERIKGLPALITDKQPKVVVLSAMSGTTNELVAISSALYKKDNKLAEALIGELEKKYENVVNELFSKPAFIDRGTELLRNHFAHIRSFTLDMFTALEEKAILAQGELLSTALLHYYLEEQGIRSVLLPALNFMKIDSREEPDLVHIEKNLLRELSAHKTETLFITQGYICRNEFGEIDNLKRGGSDYTATLIGAALKSPEIQIWTDIDGMHNNDPRIVQNTRPVTELSFDEAAELAYFGAKILHPTCVLPAQKRKVPVRLLNTMQPGAKGTLISEKVTADRVTAIAVKDGIVAIKIKSTRMLLAYGFLRSVFEVFERFKTPIDMITTSEVAVSITIDQPQNLEAIMNELREFGSVEADKDQTIICIVGNFSGDKKGYAMKIFESLRNIPIRMISYGGSEHNVSVLVNTAHKKDALISLNKGLFGE